jgi:ABC-2 type transport system ATP-binding protein
MGNQTIVKFDRITKKYGTQYGIRDLSFNIDKGEIFGFLGPNGAGKTTTIRLMLDLIKPTEGSVSIFGKTVVRHSYEIRKRIGYLPGNFMPYHKMTGIEFLRFSRELRHISDAVPKFYFDKLELSIKDLNKRISAFSQGMKQKLGIIHALAHRPELIILDEPSTGLDPLMQDALYELLIEINQQGSTIFFSSHNLPEVEKICEKVAIVKNNQLVGYESLASLRKRKQKKMILIFNKRLSAPPELANAQFIKQISEGFEYIVNGSINKLLEELSGLGLSEIYFPEPTLEDIFLGYYDKQQNTVDHEA